MRLIIEDIKQSDQQYTSANTSINSSKLPAIFRLARLKPDTVNLDYGGGKFDNATEYLKTQNVTNLIYDPFNRSTKHNSQVLGFIERNHGADTVTLSNVLNVIAEPHIRAEVLNNCKELLKPDGTLYITVYEGNKQSTGAETKAGYQLNRATREYVDEVSAIFSNVTVRGKLIIATNR